MKHACITDDTNVKDVNRMDEHFYPTIQLTKHADDHIPTHKHLFGL